MSLVDAAAARAGLRAVVLETDELRVVVVPDAGGKILELVDRASGEDLLWHNPRVPLAAAGPGAPFDDVWCGGWDELFPTDPPCEVGDNRFGDHGDLWCGPWSCAVTADDGVRATVAMARDAIALPCRMERTLTVERGSRDVRLGYRLSNLGPHPVPYTWSLHVAHAISGASRVHLPARAVVPTPPQPGRFAGARGPLAWPRADGLDLAAVLPPARGLTEWLHTVGDDVGWCAVTHPDRRVGLRVGFDPGLFRTVWTWGVYGGWRGHHVLLTEPSTSPPGGLAHAIREGTAAWLAPHEVVETAVVATVLCDVADGVAGDADPAAGPVPA